MVVLMVAGFTSAAYASHSWGGYHWARTANPFTLKLGDDVSVAWDAFLGQASVDWSKSDVLDTSVVAGGTNPKNCRPVSGRVEICNGKYGSNGWLGLASIWASGNHITQGTVKLNDTYFNTPTYNSPAWRQFVMCQEVGHTFGLNHQDENFSNLNLGTCMDYTNNPSRDDGSGNNLYPNAHDYEELDLIYAHPDSTTTIRQATQRGGAPNPDLSEPGSLGREIRRSGDGRGSLYERDLGDNNKVFTFVIWADMPEK